LNHIFPSPAEKVEGSYNW